VCQGGVVTQFAAIHCLHRRRQRRRTRRHRRCGDNGGGVRGVGERWDGRRVAADDFCLLLPLLVWLLVLNKTSVWIACMSKILTDILFYVRDIPQSTRTISEYYIIKWCW
jgi:hypothetical protein